MRALSLRQPWAWLVVQGGKLIENRRWPTRVRGPFLIHAAKGMTPDELEGARLFAGDVDPSIKLPPRLEFGGIVGRATLVDVLPPCWDAHRRGELCRHRWHMPEQYGFVLEDVRPLPFFPCRGMLGFFDVPDYPGAET